VLIDNLLTAHARRPFRGERKLLVAMGTMGGFEDDAIRALAAGG
jgi:hypothetical protein